MRFIIKIAFVLPTIFASSVNAPLPRLSVYMNECLGPLTGEQDFEILLYDTKKDANYNCKLEHFYLNSGSRYAITNCTVGSISNGYSTPLTIVSEGRMNNGGINLKFTFNDSRTLEVRMNRPEHTEINAARYKEDDVHIYRKVLFINDSKVNTTETLSFKNTNDYISTKRTNALDFSELFFTHSSFIKATYTKAVFRIYDYENIYPNLKNGSNPSIISLPLTLTQNDGVISFTYNLKMYVKTSTLQMYPRKAVGSIATTEFFVPIGSEEKMSNNAFEIYIENFGADQCNITIPLEFYDYRSLFGLCHDSDYCIEGGIIK